jgi:hypothetical protein
MLAPVKCAAWGSRVSNEHATNVVIKNSILRGSPQPEFLQQVALVYIDRQEYRVSAPPAAKGYALEWVEQFRVGQLVDFGSESIIGGPLGVYVVRLVEEELEKEQKYAHRRGRHPDLVHYSAQICRKGHVQHSDGTAFDGNAHCGVCGEPCIDQCPNCEEPIHGQDYRRPKILARPSYCHRCGKPYSWMQDKLDTARELLYHDNQLTQKDRNELEDLLKYVMSDPMGELAPAKKKLIDIILEKALPATKEFILDLTAKTMAEMARPM